MNPCNKLIGAFKISFKLGKIFNFEKFLLATISINLNLNFECDDF